MHCLNFIEHELSQVYCNVSFMRSFVYCDVSFVHSTEHETSQVHCLYLKNRKIIQKLHKNMTGSVKTIPSHWTMKRLKWDG